MKINDGQTNRVATVDDKFRLHVDALSKSVEHQANHENGISFVVPFAVTPTGAGDCFLYMKNTDEIDMIIEGLHIWMVSDQYFEIKIGDKGTPAGGSTITPTNLNGGSGKSATGIFQDGVDITGLSGGVIAYKIYHGSSQDTKAHNFDQYIVLPKNTTLSIYIQNGAVALDGYLDIFYHSV